MFNSYEVRWKKARSTVLFCTTQGTKQGGILSGYIFLEYMSILDEKLKDCPGRWLYNCLWNALFYADDVLLIGLSLDHAQKLLYICEQFEAQGLVSWNPSKTRVMYLTNSRKIKNVPEQSDLFLNKNRLRRCIVFKYLGYLVNHRLTDDDMLIRQAQRLYAIANNLARDLPLHLLDDSRLRKLTMSYGNVYLLPVLTNSTNR